ncbi:hypothetical protein LCGC14_1650010 [marine sediment metagenome]|uniref:Uncharacterized protein n=1 Tax=marine sediment metagenome TaxID=412755 RepID=A0A0F9HXW8_9ZZZZ
MAIRTGLNIIIHIIAIDREDIKAPCTQKLVEKDV